MQQYSNPDATALVTHAVVVTLMRELCVYKSVVPLYTHQLSLLVLNMLLL